MKRLALSLSLALLPLAAVAELAPGQQPPAVTLEGKAGGRVDGSPWSSAELRDKVHVMFYVDPDERTLNDHVADALKAQAFDRGRYGSVAVINMDATWLPNSILESSLEDKQKEFPDTVYVKDKRKVLVQQWGIADDNNNVIAFGPRGKVLFYRAGKLSADEVSSLIQTIKDNLPR